jgi:transposase
LTIIIKRHILDYIENLTGLILSKPDPKTVRLKALGVLNPHPERVQAPEFQIGTFFDPRDLVQVKYEMLRRVQMDGASKVDAAELFGVSRPTYYQAETAYAREGLAGLLPRQRGPKGAHKLTPRLMRFVEAHLAEHGQVGARRLAQLMQTEFGLSIHPRSIERALARKKKRQTPNR